MAGKTIDVQLLNPFITATLNCLTDMAGLKPERKRVFVKTDPQMHGFVTGVIGLTNGITGNVAVSFPKQMARVIVSRFLGDPVDNITDEMVSDGIGEVANMVAGGAKRIFAGTEYRFDISTPTIVLGSPTCIYNPNECVNIVCEFALAEVGDETFLIEIALKPKTIPG